MTQKRVKEYFIVGLIFFIIFMLIIGLGGALLPLLFSTFLAYASLPLVKFLEKKGLSRLMASSVVLFAVVFVILLALVLGLPPLFADLHDAIINLPSHLLAALEKLNGFLSEYGIIVPYDQDTLTKFTQTYLNKISSTIFQSTGTFFRTSLVSVTSAVVIILNLFLIPIFFFYVVNDFEGLLEIFKSLVPIKYRPGFERFIHECDGILSGFIRGQLLVCVILAAVYSIGLLIVGLKFAVLIGCLTGLFTFIPYVGFGMGFLAAIITALAHLSEGSGQLVGVAIVYGIGQILETYIVTPRIVGNKVGLSAFEAILALIVFGNLLGFVGLFLAIPVGAIVKIVLRDLLAAYRGTSFYRE